MCASAASQTGAPGSHGLALGLRPSWRDPSTSALFLYFFALITEEGFLISFCYSLELCIQMGISFLFSFAFHFSSFHSYLCGLLRKPFCLFCISFFGGMVLMIVSCTMSPTSAHNSSGILSDLFP